MGDLEASSESSASPRNPRHPSGPRRGREALTIRPHSAVAEAGTVLNPHKELSKSSLPGVRPRRGRDRLAFPFWSLNRLKTFKKQWFLRHFRFIGYLDINHHIKDLIITILGPSWAVLGPSWCEVGNSPGYGSAYSPDGLGPSPSKVCSDMLLGATW